MKPCTQHTQEQGVTYTEHLGFAMGIAFRLLVSVLAFAVHALLPFISIESRHDLEATATFLEERNYWIETAGQRQHTQQGHNDTGSDLARV